MHFARPLILRQQKCLIREFLMAGIVLMFVADPTRAIDHFRFEQQGKLRTVSGRVLVEAQDGSLMLEGQDGQIWTISAAEIRGRDSDESAFTYLDREQLAKNLLLQMPAGFSIYETKHYVICHNTSNDYAKWCGSLYERLYRAFFNFWKKKGLPLAEPEVLVALVFNSRPSYIDYSESELKESAAAVIGYYSLATNRITTFDLSGIEQLRRPGDRASSFRSILNRPAAKPTIATVVHEATHQLAFNSGLQRRFADNPLWLSEGLAIYFETPDLSSHRGWSKIGALNASRLAAFRSSMSKRPPDALFLLLTDDGRFRDTQQAPIAYAEAWALCFHLMRRHPDGFVRYLKAIGEKPYLQEDTAEGRLQQFQAAIQSDWQTIDAELIKNSVEWR